MERLIGKKVLIAPYSPLTIALSTHLQERGVQVVGFVDAKKHEAGVYRSTELSGLDFDFILIYNELFFDEIYKALKKDVGPKHIYRILFAQGGYTLQERSEIMRDQAMRSLIGIRKSLKIALMKLLGQTYDTLHVKRDKVVFLAKDSIGSNLKHLYLYYLAEHPHNVMMITGNEDEYQELKRSGYDCSKYGSFKSYLLMAQARTVIIEQVIHDYLGHLSSQQRTIQLWHGIALKRLYKSTTTTYDVLLSTSALTTEVVFKETFQAREIVPYGYPRNDIFFREVTGPDLLFCDKAIYTLLKSDVDNGIRTIIYMPTYREKAEENIPPLDFEQLNTTMLETNSRLIVKLHPFALELFATTIDKVYSHIVFYKTQGDIYPILKYIDILITDYSSVAYDFLMLERPMVFFDHDHEAYLQSRGEFFFDFNTYTPGPKVKTQKELVATLDEISNGIDSYQEQRVRLRSALFKHIDGDASKRISRYI